MRGELAGTHARVRVLFYQDGGGARSWLDALAAALPEAEVREWMPGDEAPADYALVWKPPAEVLQRRAGLKAVFNLGAGVDAVLAFLDAHPDVLSERVPLIRLEDAGMAMQMSNYVCAAALRHFRGFDEYARRQRDVSWRPLAPRDPASYRCGVMGAGLLGTAVARSLSDLGFSVRAWRRSAELLDGVVTFNGPHRLDDFTAGLDMVVNLLPLTAETHNILASPLFERLNRGALVINVGRGAHLVEEDLLAALASGQVGHAVLDVFRQEPLPSEHVFWRHLNITVTPHVAATTLIGPSVRQIADKIRRLEIGEAVSGIVPRKRGY